MKNHQTLADYIRKAGAERSAQDRMIQGTLYDARLDVPHGDKDKTYQLMVLGDEVRVFDGKRRLDNKSPKKDGEKELHALAQAIVAAVETSQEFQAFLNPTAPVLPDTDENIPTFIRTAAPEPDPVLTVDAQPQPSRLRAALTAENIANALVVSRTGDDYEMVIDKLLVTVTVRDGKPIQCALTQVENHRNVDQFTIQESPFFTGAEAGDIDMLLREQAQRFNYKQTQVMQSPQPEVTILSRMLEADSFEVTLPDADMEHVFNRITFRAGDQSVAVEPRDDGWNIIAADGATAIPVTNPGLRDSITAAVTAARQQRELEALYTADTEKVVTVDVPPSSMADTWISQRTPLSTPRPPLPEAPLHEHLAYHVQYGENAPVEIGIINAEDKNPAYKVEIPVVENGRLTSEMLTFAVVRLENGNIRLYELEEKGQEYVPHHVDENGTRISRTHVSGSARQKRNEGMNLSDVSTALAARGIGAAAEVPQVPETVVAATDDHTRATQEHAPVTPNLLGRLLANQEAIVFSPNHRVAGHDHAVIVTMEDNTRYALVLAGDETQRRVRLYAENRGPFGGWHPVDEQGRDLGPLSRGEAAQKRDQGIAVGEEDFQQLQRVYFGVTVTTPEPVQSARPQGDVPFDLREREEPASSLSLLGRPAEMAESPLAVVESRADNGVYIMRPDSENVSVAFKIHDDGSVELFAWYHDTDELRPFGFYRGDPRLVQALQEKIGAFRPAGLLMEGMAVPKERPAFPFTAEQIAAGAMVKDNEQGGADTHYVLQVGGEQVDIYVSNANPRSIQYGDGRYQVMDEAIMNALTQRVAQTFPLSAVEIAEAEITIGDSASMLRSGDRLVAFFKTEDGSIQWHISVRGQAQDSWQIDTNPGTAQYLEEKVASARPVSAPVLEETPTFSNDAVASVGESIPAVVPLVADNATPAFNGANLSEGNIVLNNWDRVTIVPVEGAPGDYQVTVFMPDDQPRTETYRFSNNGHGEQYFWVPAQGEPVEIRDGATRGFIGATIDDYRQQHPEPSLEHGGVVVAGTGVQSDLEAASVSADPYQIPPSFDFTMDVVAGVENQHDEGVDARFPAYLVTFQDGRAPVLVERDGAAIGVFLLDEEHDLVMQNGRPVAVAIDHPTEVQEQLFNAIAERANGHVAQIVAEVAEENIPTFIQLAEPTPVVLPFTAEALQEATIIPRREGYGDGYIQLNVGGEGRWFGVTGDGVTYVTNPDAEPQDVVMVAVPEDMAAAVQQQFDNARGTVVTIEDVLPLTEISEPVAAEAPEPVAAEPTFVQRLTEALQNAPTPELREIQGTQGVLVRAVGHNHKEHDYRIFPLNNGQVAVVNGANQWVDEDGKGHKTKSGEALAHPFDAPELHALVMEKVAALTPVAPEQSVIEPETPKASPPPPSPLPHDIVAGKGEEGIWYDAASDQVLVGWPFIHALDSISSVAHGEEENSFILVINGRTHIFTLSPETQEVQVENNVAATSGGIRKNADGEIIDPYSTIRVEWIAEKAPQGTLPRPLENMYDTQNGHQPLKSKDMLLGALAERFPDHPLLAALRPDIALPEVAEIEELRAAQLTPAEEAVALAQRALEEISGRWDRRDGWCATVDDRVVTVNFGQKKEQVQITVGGATPEESGVTYTVENAALLQALADHAKAASVPKTEAVPQITDIFLGRDNDGGIYVYPVGVKDHVPGWYRLTPDNPDAPFERAPAGFAPDHRTPAPIMIKDGKIENIYENNRMLNALISSDEFKVLQQHLPRLHEIVTNPDYTLNAAGEDVPEERVAMAKTYEVTGAPNAAGYFPVTIKQGGSTSDQHAEYKIDPSGKVFMKNGTNDVPVTGADAQAIKDAYDAYAPSVVSTPVPSSTTTVSASTGSRLDQPYIEVVEFKHPRGRGDIRPDAMREGDLYIRRRESETGDWVYAKVEGEKGSQYLKEVTTPPSGTEQKPKAKGFPESGDNPVLDLVAAKKLDQRVLEDALVLGAKGGAKYLPDSNFEGVDPDNARADAVQKARQLVNHARGRDVVRSSGREHERVQERSQEHGGDGNWGDLAKNGGEAAIGVGLALGGVWFTGVVKRLVGDNPSKFMQGIGNVLTVLGMGVTVVGGGLTLLGGCRAGKDIFEGVGSLLNRGQELANSAAEETSRRVHQITQGT